MFSKSEYSALKLFFWAKFSPVTSFKLEKSAEVTGEDESDDVEWFTFYVLNVLVVFVIVLFSDLPHEAKLNTRIDKPRNVDIFLFNIAFTSKIYLYYTS